MSRGVADIVVTLSGLMSASTLRSGTCDVQGNLSKLRFSHDEIEHVTAPVSLIAAAVNAISSLLSRQLVVLLHTHTRSEMSTSERGES